MQREFPSDFNPEIETLISREEFAERHKEEYREFCLKQQEECTFDECTCHLDLDKDKPQKENKKSMRQFDTGATRDTDLDKLDFEGFLSPLVIKRYAEYLNEHRVQADGNLRDSDNWQQGIPIKVYMKSKWRHFVDCWMIFRGYGPVRDPKDNHIITMEEALCGEIFNASGHLHELLKEKLEPQKPQPETIPEVERNSDGHYPDYS